MSLQLGSLLVWAAISGTPSASPEAPVYANYKEAYNAAKEVNRPVLVILNPGTEADAKPVEIDAVRKTAHRRDLLENYVVAVIDTSTPEGQKVHKLFDSPPLPRVSVIDKQQKWQIYRTSRALTAEDWNLVLETYRTGERPPVAAPRCNCSLGQ